MTKAQQNKLDKGTHYLVSKWEIGFRYTILSTLAILIYSFSSTQTSYEERMFDDSKQKNDIVNHVEKPHTIHMTLKEKQEEFVTRREYESVIKAINKSLLSIDSKIDKQ